MGGPGREARARGLVDVMVQSISDLFFVAVGYGVTVSVYLTTHVLPQMHIHIDSHRFTCMANRKSAVNEMRDLATYI